MSYLINSEQTGLENLIGLINQELDIPITQADVTFGIPKTVVDNSLFERNSLIRLTSTENSSYHGETEIYYQRLTLPLASQTDVGVITASIHEDTDPLEILSIISDRYGFVLDQIQFSGPPLFPEWGTFGAIKIVPIEDSLIYLDSELEIQLFNTLDGNPSLEIHFGEHRLHSDGKRIYTVFGDLNLRSISDGELSTEQVWYQFLNASSLLSAQALENHFISSQWLIIKGEVSQYEDEFLNTLIPIEVKSGFGYFAEEAYLLYNRTHEVIEKIGDSTHPQVPFEDAQGFHFILGYFGVPEDAVSVTDYRVDQGIWRIVFDVSEDNLIFLSSTDQVVQIQVVYHNEIFSIQVGEYEGLPLWLMEIPNYFEDPSIVQTSYSYQMLYDLFQSQFNTQSIQFPYLLGHARELNVNGFVGNTTIYFGMNIDTPNKTNGYLYYSRVKIQFPEEVVEDPPIEIVESTPNTVVEVLTRLFNIPPGDVSIYPEITDEDGVRSVKLEVFLNSAIVLPGEYIYRYRLN